MSKRLIAAAIAVWLWRGELPAASGMELGATLTGEVTFFESIYGETVWTEPKPGEIIPALARVIYDTESPAIHNLGSCDCATYRQSVYNGLSVQFGLLTVSAHEYDVHVINAPVGGADFVRIVFASDYSPQFGTAIVVNGEERPSGQLVLSFRDSTGAALNGSQLPELYELQQFQTFDTFLRESPEEDYVVAAVLEAPTTLPLLSADFSQDGSVDGADLLIWQRSVGTAYPSPADGDHNRAVDSADLALWRAHFGAEVGSLGRPLAEPVTLGLAMPLFLAIGVLRRQ